MARLSITIDDTVAQEIADEAREGESTAQTIERLVVTAVGRLAASRKYSRKKEVKPKAKKAKAKAKKAKAPKVEGPPVTQDDPPAVNP